MYMVNNMKIENICYIPPKVYVLAQYLSGKYFKSFVCAGRIVQVFVDSNYIFYFEFDGVDKKHGKQIIAGLTGKDIFKTKKSAINKLKEVQKEELKNK